MSDRTKLLLLSEADILDITQRRMSNELIDDHTHMTKTIIRDFLYWLSINHPEKWKDLIG